jgi:outer membrane biosynthesis protein TonB
VGNGTERGRGVIKLRLLKAGEVVRTFKSRSDSLTIGTAQGCTFRAAGDPSLAPKHATIYVDDGAVSVVPEPGLTVLLNGEAVDFAMPGPDDVLKVGRITFKVELAESMDSIVPPPSGARISMPAPAPAPASAPAPAPAPVPTVAVERPVAERIPVHDRTPSVVPRPAPVQSPTEVEQPEEAPPQAAAEPVVPADGPSPEAAVVQIEPETGSESDDTTQVTSCPESPAPYRKVVMKPEVQFDAQEVEHGSGYATEVITLWQDTVLQHTVAGAGGKLPGGFYVGEKPSCDFQLRSGLLHGSTKLPLVFRRQGDPWITILPEPRGDVTFEDGSRSQLSDLVSTGRAEPSAKPPGCHVFRLPQGARAKVDIGDFVFLVNSVARPRKLTKFGRWSSDQVSFFFFSVLLHGLLLFLAIFDVSTFSGESFGAEENLGVVQYELTPAELKKEKQKEDKKKKDEKKDEGKRRRDDKDGVASRDSNRSIKHTTKSSPEAVRSVLSVLSRATVKEFEMAGDPLLAEKPGHDFMGVLAGLPSQDLDLGGRGGIVATMSGEEVAGKGSGVAKLTGGQHHGGVRGKVTKMSSALTVQGNLSRDEITRVVNEHIYQIQACYERALMSKPGLAGKIVFDWTVNLKGRVSGVRVRSSSLGSPEVATCISGLIRGWKFTSPVGGDVIVTYPFLFRMSS